MYFYVDSADAWDRFMVIHKSNSSGISDNAGSNGHIFAKYHTTSTFAVELHDLGHGSLIMSNSSLTVGSWIHIVFAINGSNYKFYQDGSVVNSGTFTNGPYTESVHPITTLFMNYSNNGTPQGTPAGKLKHFRYWHGTELSQSNVSA